MKTPIAVRIETYLNRSPEQRLTQKELAARLHDRCPQVKHGTIEEKLSKLMNGHEEGERFFKGAEQIRALSEELNEPSEYLQRLLQLPTLILHPKLPESMRSYVLERASECHGTAEWIIAPAVADDGKDGRAEPIATIAAIQQARRDIKRPVLVLVTEEMVARMADRSIYEVATLPFAVLVQKCRGYEIVDHAEVLPLPSIPPPKVVDDDGRRLYEVNDMAAQADHAWRLHPTPMQYSSQSAWQQFGERLTKEHPEPESGWEPNGPRLGLRYVSERYSEAARSVLQRLSSALKVESIPTFRAGEVLRWFCSRADVDASVRIALRPPSFVQLLAMEVAQSWGTSCRSWHVPGDGSSRDELEHDVVAEHIAGGRFGRTTIWQDAERWFIVGDRANEVRERLRGYCPELELEAPAFPARLAQLLRDNHNPWSEGAEWFSEWSQSAKDECGVHVDDAIRLWRNQALLKDAERHCYYEFEGAAEPQAQHARERLRLLLKRRFELEETEAWVVFALRQALNAQILFADADLDCSSWNVVAHLGAGHLIRLRVMQYPVEAEDCLRMMTPGDFKDFSFQEQPTETHLDGGDIHVQIDVLPDAHLLEGTVVHGARRRQAEEERLREARDEDEDGYDDDE